MEEIKEERNWGIETLRMLAMFMVLILHILRQDGVLTAGKQYPVQYKTAWFLEIAAYCAVNCYALISGYVGIRRPYKYTSIIELWLRVLFYSILGTFVVYLINPGQVGRSEWIKALFPIMKSQYWFFTAYFAAFFFLPVSIMAAKKLTKKQYTMLLIGLIIVLSLLPTLFRTDAFQMRGGYCAVWLLVLYMIGGYIRIYGLFENRGKLLWGVGYLIIITLTWLSKMLLERLGKNGNILVSYTSPTILLAALMLLGLFKEVHFSTGVAKWLRYISPAVFSVYLIHANPLMWSNVFVKTIVRFTSYHPCILVLVVLLYALVFFVVCVLFDLIRNQLVKVLKIKKQLLTLEEKLIGNIWE